MQHHTLGIGIFSTSLAALKQDLCRHQLQSPKKTPGCIVQQDKYAPPPRGKQLKLSSFFHPNSIMAYPRLTRNLCVEFDDCIM